MSVRAAGLRQAPYRPTKSAPLYSGGDFSPPSDDTYDLGSSTLAWQDGYFDGTVYTDLISEFGAAQGVTVDGVLLKDSGARFGDNALVQWGADGDVGTVLSSAGLAANTASTGVLIGTPVTAATPANSLLQSIITTSGDFAWFLNDGSGNSWEYLRFDSSLRLVVFNEASSDIDFRIEADGNANGFVLDAGTGQIGIGTGVSNNNFMQVAAVFTPVSGFGSAFSVGAATITALNNSNAHLLTVGATANTINKSSAGGTHSLFTGVYLDRPSIGTGTDTVTTAATVYIQRQGTGGTTNFALWVDAGIVAVDETLVVGAGENLTAATVNGTFRAPNVATGGAGNIAGADVTITAGLGTGTGDVGTIIFSLPIVAVAGDNIQTTATRLTLDMVSSSTVLTMNFAQGVILADAGTAWITLTAGGGMQMGAPSGGDKGLGTINAVAVYDDNVLLTDWAFDLYFDGAVRADDPFWRGQRLYTLADTYEMVQRERHLPWMPTRANFEAERGLGSMVTRLWEGQEQQQLHLFEVMARVERLEHQLRAVGLTPAV